MSCFGWTRIKLGSVSQDGQKLVVVARCVQINPMLSSALLFLSEKQSLALPCIDRMK
jgi:hypothetical protein